MLYLHELSREQNRSSVTVCCRDDSAANDADKLQKDENFDPYLNLKVVLVEEGGQLKVGYFEFLPPSIWD
jgi:glycerol-3-phosphate dehydrogenase